MTAPVTFSSTGREWAATSNEGLLFYFLDDNMIFHLISFTEELIPGAVNAKLRTGKHSIALLIRLHLNFPSPMW
jgi:periodic tryptophan protein 2